ncbi:MAG TPA: AIR synthase-related protein, partial [Puia sp.]|nr:AIR synthase-related protein [Puia sp.]
DFKEEGDFIFLVGKSNGDMNSSEYLHKLQNVEFSPAPHFAIEEEFQLQQKVSELIKLKLIDSAHDVSEGGLFITLAESAFANNLGFDVVASDFNIRKDAYWFGESQSRIVVSVQPEKINGFKKALGNHPYEELGIVTAGSVEVDGMNWDNIFYWKEKYENAIGDLLSAEKSEEALSAL